MQDLKNFILTKSEKIHLGIKEIAKRVREQLKKEFPNCEFSVWKEDYSMGCSLHIALMSTNFKVIKDFSEISEEAIIHNGRAKEEIKKYQEEKYQQLNQYALKQEYNSLEWCNGVFLTEQGHKVLKRVVEISDYYNYDDSDMQSDYSDVNFHLSLTLGKWNKPFVQSQEKNSKS